MPAGRVARQTRRGPQASTWTPYLAAFALEPPKPPIDELAEHLLLLRYAVSWLEALAPVLPPSLRVPCGGLASELRDRLHESFKVD